MCFVRSPVVSKDSGQASADAEEAWWQVARGAVLRFFEAFLEVRLGILAWSKKSCNMHLRCLLRYVLSNNWISISIKYCNFTFANGLQICVDASTSACILALAGEAQDNLAIQEVSQMAPFGLWHKVLQKLPRLGTWHKACSETLPEAFFAGYFVLPDFQVKLSIWSETSLNQSQPCWI